MKSVVQRVTDASVTVSDEEGAHLERGLLVYLGVAEGDTPEDVTFLSRKILELRIFNDSKGKMNLSVLEMLSPNQKIGILVVSQFTLLANTRKGRRPSYNAAAPPSTAHRLYEMFVSQCLAAGVPTITGTFGHHMAVRYTNDGPVTIIIDSRIK